MLWVALRNNPLNHNSSLQPNSRNKFIRQHNPDGFFICYIINAYIRDWGPITANTSLFSRRKNTYFPYVLKNTYRCRPGYI